MISSSSSPPSGIFLCWSAFNSFRKCTLLLFCLSKREWWYVPDD
jgi:hypothetical protein